MRKYIHREELTAALTQLLHDENPELTEVYIQIVHARLKHNTPQAQIAQAMLMIPVRIGLACINLILLPMAALLFLSDLALALESWMVFTILLAAISYLLYTVMLIGDLVSRAAQCRPYLLIDELFSRRILILRQVPSTRVKTAK